MPHDHIHDTKCIVLALGNGLDRLVPIQDLVIIWTNTDFFSEEQAWPNVGI